MAKLDWERSSKQELVAARGGDRVDAEATSSRKPGKHEKRLLAVQAEQRRLSLGRRKALNLLEQQLRDTPARRRAAYVGEIRRLVRAQASSEVAYEAIWSKRFAPLLSGASARGQLRLQSSGFRRELPTTSSPASKRSQEDPPPGLTTVQARAVTNAAINLVDAFPETLRIDDIAYVLLARRGSEVPRSVTRSVWWGRFAGLPPSAVERQIRALVGQRIVKSPDCWAMTLPLRDKSG